MLLSPPLVEALVAPCIFSSANALMVSPEQVLYVQEP